MKTTNRNTVLENPDFELFFPSWYDNNSSVMFCYERFTTKDHTIMFDGHNMEIHSAGIFFQAESDSIRIHAEWKRKIRFI